jgi:SNF2 family DNA or RNA helicase
MITFDREYEPLWPGFEHYYSNFANKCSVDEYRILQVLSLADLPLPPATLERIIKRLGWQSEDGQPLLQQYNKMLARWWSKWEQEEWVSNDSERLRCSRFLVDLLSRMLQKDGLVEPVIAAIQREISAGYWVSGVDPGLRSLRFAFYREEWETIRKWLGLEVENLWQGTLSADKGDVLTNLCYFPVQPGWLQRLPDWLHYHALVNPIRTDLLEVDGTTLLWDFWTWKVEPAVSENPELIYAAASFRLLRGETEWAETLLQGVETEALLPLQGWCAMARNDLARARSLLEQVRHFPAQGPGPLFLQMLYLQEGSLSARQRVVALARQREAQLEQTGLSPMDEPFAVAVALMGEVAQLLSGELQISQNTLLQRQRLHSPWDQLLQAIARYWVGERVSTAQLDELQQHAKRAASVGITLYTQQLELLLQQIRITASGEEQSPTEAGWAGLMRPKQQWERVLDAINSMAEQSERTQHAQQDLQLRLAWRIQRQPQGLPLLQPREQRLGKSGRWSKGRALSLKKLYEERDQYPYLSAQDNRICNTISERTIYSSASYQRKPLHELHPERALLALCGHPAVELESGIALDVVQQEPALEVVSIEEGKSLKVQLVPFPPELESGGFGSVGTHWEGGRRLVVCRFEAPYLQVARILGAEGTTIPFAARQRLLDSISTIAPLLTVHSAIGGTAQGVQQVEGETLPHIHLLPEGEGIRISYWVAPMGERGPRFYPGKGGTVVFAEVEGQQLQAHRNLQQEQQRALAILGQLEAAVPDLLFDVDEEHLLDERLVEDPEEALELLFTLRALGDDEAVLDWPQDARIPRLREAHVGQMRIGVQEGREWFALQGELQVDQGQVIALKELWRILGESRGRFLKMEDGVILALSRELQRRLEMLRSYGGEESRIHPLALSAMDEALEGMQFQSSLSWEQQRDRIAAANQLQPALPRTLEAELRDYQLQGYQWMVRLAHWGAGACLADDMGLGKTLQALSMALSRATEGPTLVLAPTSVCMNWAEEATRFAPTLQPAIFGDYSGEERTQLIEEAGSFDLVICSYGLLQREAKLLQSIEWQTVVVDEAQAIKNASTKRSQAVMGLNGRFRLVTTGTPIENHLGELWNLFRFINPGLLGSLERFNERFARPIEVEKSDEARKRLKGLIAPFILRRLKRDVLTELPPRTEITLHVEMREEEATFMEALRQRSIERIASIRQHGSSGPQHLQILAEITRLRQACCHPRLVDADSTLTSAKHRVFSEVVDELLENGHRALVFSQFVSHLSLIREQLDRKGVGYQYLDGSTPVGKRKEAVDAFQGGEGELFLISLKAGGSGLNLTAADYVIHMDPWWNPAVEDQASDRAHRMGQTRPVTIYRLVVKGTIEEKIVDLHQHKRDLADQLLEGSDQGGRLSVDEMMALIQDASGG